MEITISTLRHLQESYRRIYLDGVSPFFSLSSSRKVAFSLKTESSFIGRNIPCYTHLSMYISMVSANSVHSDKISPCV